MEALVVTVVVLLTVRMVGAVVLILAERPRHRPPGRPVDPCLASLLAVPPTPAPDPEQVLLDRLRRGAIDREQYRVAMAEIAHRDAAARPWRVPAR